VCPYCKGSWEVSRGPGRTLGAVARSFEGIFLPLPDDFEFEYCPRCKTRNLTPELEGRFARLEETALHIPGDAAYLKG